MIIKWPNCLCFAVLGLFAMVVGMNACGSNPSDHEQVEQTGELFNGERTSTEGQSGNEDAALEESSTETADHEKYREQATEVSTSPEPLADIADAGGIIEHLPDRDHPEQHPTEQPVFNVQILRPSENTRHQGPLLVVETEAIPLNRVLEISLEIGGKVVATRTQPPFIFFAPTSEYNNGEYQIEIKARFDNGTTQSQTRKLFFVRDGIGLSGEVRALWVTRWECNSEAKLNDVLRLMQDHHLNTLIIQAYGDAMALYPSQIAPLSPLVKSGFDLLKTAVRLAQPFNIQVHAWFNVINVYSGALGVPADPKHIIRAHPTWTMVDQSGQRSVDNVGKSGTTIWYCPEQKGFVNYIASLVEEAVQHAAIDGIHLDYIRYPSGSNFCFCDEHKRNFQAAHGREAQAADPDFTQWRMDSITSMLQEIRKRIDATRPNVILSTATFPNYQSVLQDIASWTRRGHVDWLLPMIYSGTPNDIAAHVAKYIRYAGGRYVLAGLDVKRTELSTHIDTVRNHGTHGISLFSYSGIDAGAKTTLKQKYPTNQKVPQTPWRDGSPDHTVPILATPKIVYRSADMVILQWWTNKATSPSVILMEPDTPQTKLIEIAAKPDSYEHLAVLSTLKPNITYRYHVRSNDQAGNSAVSAESKFTTLATGSGDIIIDDGDYFFQPVGTWHSGSSPGGHNDNYLYASTFPQARSSAVWTPYLPTTAEYEVFIWYVAGSNRSKDVTYQITHAHGSTTKTINQESNGRQWLTLGKYTFNSGQSGKITLFATGQTGQVAIADAIKFSIVGHN